jgi:hypothetical protein
MFPGEQVPNDGILTLGATEMKTKSTSHSFHFCQESNWIRVSFSCHYQKTGMLIIMDNIIIVH